MPPNTVRGLGVVDRVDAPGQRMGTRRAAPADISQAQYRPTSTPTDTTVRPMMNSGAGSELLQLSRALGAFNPALDRAADSFVRSEEETQSQLAAAKLQSMTFEEAQKATKDGTLPEWSNPWFRAGFKKLFGQTLGYRYSNKLAEAYETGGFDRRNGDIQQFVAEQSQEYLKGVEGDPFVIAGLNAVMPGVNEKMKAAHGAWLNEEVRAETRDNVFQRFSGVVSDGLAAGQTPEQIMGVLNAHTEDVAKVLFIPPSEQAELWLTVARTQAEAGNVDMVRAIVTAQRNGVPPLAETARHAVAVADLLSKAEAAALKVKGEKDWLGISDLSFGASKGSLTDAQIAAAVEDKTITSGQAASLRAQNLAAQQAARDRMAKEAEKARFNALLVQQENDRKGGHIQAIQAGNFYGISGYRRLNKDGSETWVTDEQARKEADSEFSEWAASDAARRGLSAEDALNYELTARLKNGMPSAAWAALISNGWATASGVWNMSGDNPQMPPALDGAYDLYRKLRAVSPQFLSKHITDQDALKFYRLVDAGTDIGQWDRQQAYAAAMRVTRDSRIGQGRAFSFTDDQINRAFRDIGVQNAGSLGPDVEDMAQMYVALGLGKQAALDRAVSDIRETHMTVRGSMIPWNRINSPEAVTEETFEAYIQQFAETHKETLDKLGVDTDDLTLVPIGNSTDAFMILDGPAPLSATAFPGSRFSTRDLEAISATLDEKRAQERIDAHSRRFDPWFETSWISVGPFTAGNEEAAEVARRREQRKADRDQADEGAAARALRGEGYDTYQRVSRDRARGR